MSSLDQAGIEHHGRRTDQRKDVGFLRRTALTALRVLYSSSRSLRLSWNTTKPPRFRPSDLTLGVKVAFTDLEPHQNSDRPTRRSRGKLLRLRLTQLPCVSRD
jgi:hypothetical protein